MKTTVDIADELLIAAKQRAAQERSTLKTLIERGLRTQLRRQPSEKRARRAIRWVTVNGGGLPGTNLADREAMHERLRRDR